MEARVLKENLEAAVIELARIAPTRTSLPITANVLLATEDGRLAVTATDLEVAVKAYIGAQIETEGACTVPARTLAQMLKRIKADEAMTVKAEKGATTFVMGERRLSLEGADADDFPPIPSDFDKRGVVEGGELKDRLKRVAICTATDDSRPALTTVNMRVEGDTLTLAAADGFRLAVFTLPYKGDAFEANVAPSVVKALGRLLPDDGVGIDVGPTAIRFAFGAYDVTGQGLQSTFPNYSQLVPKEYDHAVEVQRDDLRGEVETAMVLASEGTGIVRLQTEQDALRITAKSEGSGDYTGTIPASVEAEPGRVGVNGRFLLDLLGGLEPGPFRMDWKPNQPIRLRQSDDGLYIVMPMVVAWEN